MKLKEIKSILKNSKYFSKVEIEDEVEINEVLLFGVKMMLIS